MRVCYTETRCSAYRLVASLHYTYSAVLVPIDLSLATQLQSPQCKDLTQCRKTTNGCLRSLTVLGPA